MTEVAVEPVSIHITPTLRLIGAAGAKKLEVAAFARVLSIESAPPSSPANGARYIVGTSPTGAFAGHAGSHAIWSGSTWTFIVPSDGNVVSVDDVHRVLVYLNGAWGPLGDVTQAYVDTQDSAHAAAVDPHTGYILASGMRAFAGVVAGIDPTAGAHLTTRTWVDGQVAAAIVTANTHADAADAAHAASADPHGQYVRADGTRAFTAPVAGITPTLGAHFVTKDFVEQLLSGLDWQESVLDKDLTVPPGMPNAGDRYYVAPANAAAWGGSGIATRNDANTAWVFTALDVGTAFFVEDEGIGYTLTGSGLVKTGALVEHQALIGAGTNTHAQIDAHLASTANPHGVTKGQIGLSSVTDDAQLKRAGNDYAGFAVKAQPAGADILLIEDAASSNAKKRTTVAGLFQAADSVLGVGTIATAATLHVSSGPLGAGGGSAIRAQTTWGDAATTFAAILVEVTNTASSSTSRLLDLRVGGASQASFSKTGVLELLNGAVQTVQGGSTGLALRGDKTTSTGPVVTLSNLSQWIGTNGIQVGTLISASANQGGTAGYDLLQIAATHNAVGSGSKNLINALVGGQSMFTVSASGIVSATRFIAPPGAFQYAGSGGAISIDVSAHNDYAQSDTLGGATVCTLANGVDGAQGTILFRQDGTGRELSFVASGRAVVVMGTLSISANKHLACGYMFATTNGTACLYIFPSAN